MGHPQWHPLLPLLRGGLPRCQEAVATTGSWLQKGWSWGVRVPALGETGSSVAISGPLGPGSPRASLLQGKKRQQRACASCSVGTEACWGLGRSLVIAALGGIALSKRKCLLGKEATGQLLFSALFFTLQRFQGSPGNGLLKELVSGEPLVASPLPLAVPSLQPRSHRTHSCLPACQPARAHPEKQPLPFQLRRAVLAWPLAGLQFWGSWSGCRPPRQPPHGEQAFRTGLGHILETAHAGV